MQFQLNEIPNREKKPETQLENQFIIMFLLFIRIDELEFERRPETLLGNRPPTGPQLKSTTNKIYT